MKYSKTFVLKNHLQFANQFFFIYLNLSVHIYKDQTIEILANCYEIFKINYFVVCKITVAS